MTSSLNVSYIIWRTEWVDADSEGKQVMTKTYVYQLSF